MKIAPQFYLGTTESLLISSSFIKSLRIVRINVLKQEMVLLLGQ